MKRTSTKLLISAGLALTIRPVEDFPYEALPVKPKSWAELNRGKMSKKQRRGK